MKTFLITLALPFLLLTASQAETSTAEKPAVDLKFAAALKAEGYSAVKLIPLANQFLIEVTIGGKKGTFLLDSGAMACILKSDSVKKYTLKMTETDNVEAVGVGGSIEIESIATTSNLKCGNGSNISQSFYVMSMDHLPKEIRAKLDGIIGTDFLKAQKGIFDFGNQVLWLPNSPEPTSDSSKFAEKMKPLDYKAIKFVEEHNHLFTAAAIAGTKARFLIDSGAGISLFKKSAVHKYDFEIIKGHAVINGLGGPTEINAMAKTKALGFNEDTTTTQSFYVMDMSKWSENYADRLDGVLGNDFLKANNTLIDYARNALWIKES